MKVKAIREGFYDNKRRKVGHVFELREIKGFKQEGPRGKLVPHTFSIKEQFSKSWMEPVDATTWEADAPIVGKGSRAPRPLSKKVESQKITDLDVI